jgi:hypothetical protein
MLKPPKSGKRKPLEIGEGYKKINPLAMQGDLR